MNTILQQLGGNKFIAMTGAKNFVQDGDKMLAFSLPRGADNGINKIKITLQNNDLYWIEFYKLRGVELTGVDMSFDIYADKLQETFTNITGLDTHL